MTLFYKKTKRKTPSSLRKSPSQIERVPEQISKEFKEELRRIQAEVMLKTGQRLSIPKLTSKLTQTQSFKQMKKELLELDKKMEGILKKEKRWTY